MEKNSARPVYPRDWKNKNKGMSHDEHNLSNHPLLSGKAAANSRTLVPLTPVNSNTPSEAMALRIQALATQRRKYGSLVIFFRGAALLTCKREIDADAGSNNNASVKLVGSSSS